MKTVIFPTDFSHASDAALGLATTYAKEHSAKLLIVHVEEPALAYGGGELYYGALEPSRDELSNLLVAIKPTDDSVPFEHRLVTGSPAEAVVRLATEENAEAIVMSTHGRTGPLRILMGSVAEAIVRRAPCPVMTWKPTPESIAP